MKILADENFPLRSIQLLRKSGFDVKAIGADFPGVTDKLVLELAVFDKRTILTFDRDYGELIFKYDYKPNQGVIYFRIFDFKPAEPAQILIKLLNNQALDFTRRITVIESETIRQRKY